MNPLVRADLSAQAKQSLQLVALIATVLVVGIHYRSDAPDSPHIAEASYNELAQEFLFGGVARVAVPLFAFAAGLFYFRTDDGSLECYRRKLSQRLRTLLIPYFIIASVATAVWMLAGRLEGSRELTIGQFISTWLWRPPAEQLWFLRDLMVLVLIAPAVRRLVLDSGPLVRGATLGSLAVAWGLNLQLFPLVSGWYLLNVETLLFFVIGCFACSRLDWVEKCCLAQSGMVGIVTTIWLVLVGIRVVVRPDFDLWYTREYGWFDLLLHQASILVGCVALLMIAGRLRSPWLVRLSGASFFVYLVHEFPLRAIVERFSDPWIDHSVCCWILTPLVLVGCFAVAFLLCRCCPVLFAVLTGGRSPSRATEITRVCPLHSTPANVS